LCVPFFLLPVRPVCDEPFFFPPLLAEKAGTLFFWLFFFSFSPPSEDSRTFSFFPFFSAVSVLGLGFSFPPLLLLAPLPRRRSRKLSFSRFADLYLYLFPPFFKMFPPFFSSGERRSGLSFFFPPPFMYGGTDLLFSALFPFFRKRGPSFLLGRVVSFSFLF